MIIVSSRQGSVTLSRKTITTTRVANITISVETEANYKFASLTRHSGLLSTLDSDPQFPFDPEHLRDDSSTVRFELSPPSTSPPPQLNGDCNCESGREPDSEAYANADGETDAPPVASEEDLADLVAQMVLANESSETCSHLTNGTLDVPEVPSPQGSCSPPHSPTSPTPSGSKCISPNNSEVRLRKNSPPAKRVTFADECGRQLATTHIFSEPNFLDMDLSVSPTQLANSPNFSSVAACPIAIHFEQPAGNYLAFKARLEACNLALENVLVELADVPPGAESAQAAAFGVPTGKEWRVYGTIKVKNISFHKYVFVRATTDNWWSSSDVASAYVPPAECVAGAASGGPAPLENTASAYVAQFASSTVAHSVSDTFSFDLREVLCKLLSSASLESSGERQIEFCLGYETCGQKYWDNNDSHNYVVTCTLPTRSIDAGSARPSGTANTKRHQRLPITGGYSQSTGDFENGNVSLFGVSSSFSDYDEDDLNTFMHDLKHQRPFTREFRQNFEKYRGRRGSFAKHFVGAHSTQK